MMHCTICQRRINVNTSGLCGPHYRALYEVALDERNKAINAARNSGEPVRKIAARFAVTPALVRFVSRSYDYVAPSHRIADLSAYICERMAVSRAQLLGQSRKMQYVRARQAIALLALRAGHSSTVVGRALGRDHSTILHSRDKAMDRAKREPEYAALLDAAWRGEPRPKVLSAVPRQPIAPRAAPTVRDYDMEAVTVTNAAIASGSASLLAALQRAA